MSNQNGMPTVADLANLTGQALPRNWGLKSASFVPLSFRHAFRRATRARLTSSPPPLTASKRAVASRIDRLLFGRDRGTGTGGRVLLTGTVASGKSTLAAHLSRSLPGSPGLVNLRDGQSSSSAIGSIARSLGLDGAVSRRDLHARTLVIDNAHVLASTENVMYLLEESSATLVLVTGNSAFAAALEKRMSSRASRFVTVSCSTDPAAEALASAGLCDDVGGHNVSARSCVLCGAQPSSQECGSGTATTPTKAAPAAKSSALRQRASSTGVSGRRWCSCPQVACQPEDSTAHVVHALIRDVFLCAIADGSSGDAATRLLFSLIAALDAVWQEAHSADGDDGGADVLAADLVGAEMADCLLVALTAVTAGWRNSEQTSLAAVSQAGQGAGDQLRREAPGEHPTHLPPSRPVSPGGQP